MSPKMLPNETSDQDSKTIAGDETNPFSNMGFLKFWILSTFFYLTFPLSLLIAFLLLGPRRARQLVSALSSLRNHYAKIYSGKLIRYIEYR